MPHDTSATLTCGGLLGTRGSEIRSQAMELRLRTVLRSLRRPRPRLPNVPIVLAPPVAVLRGFHHSTILDSCSPALAGRPRRRALVALAPPSTIAGSFVFFCAGALGRVVPVAWRSESGIAGGGRLPSGLGQV